MGSSWYFVVNGERVEIHVRSSCGTFTLATLPDDWRQQFMQPQVQDAILAELDARQTLSLPRRRKSADEPVSADSIPMSWYSVRARLLPATRDPLAAVADCGELGAPMMAPSVAAAAMAATA